MTERFQQYLGDASAGKAKIVAGDDKWDANRGLCGAWCVGFRVKVKSHGNVSLSHSLQTPNFKWEDQMIKRVFLFSDMEFDQASSNRWEIDYQVIVRKFAKKGYGYVIPENVFWNLRVSRATPVPGTQKGVALNLMKLFLDGEGDIRPEAVMEEAISGEKIVYNYWQVAGRKVGSLSDQVPDGNQQREAFP
ncbi:unnamed protein product [Dovyalis caffra]|uniref:DUF7788 domain-containing protein n=1 Tax=Dovyalis caffra TaxID=77055 RepID=A0AAV1RI24_9ROSI|nr:unnamed protein product [Dovyalis caffra]